VYLTGTTYSASFPTMSPYQPQSKSKLGSAFVTKLSAGNGPGISLVANAEGESPTIAPNTWVEIKGSGLAPAGDERTWENADFASGTLPTSLDGVSVMVNNKPAFVYFISPQQINILTPAGSMSGQVPVQVTNGSTVVSATVQAAAQSPSFFVFGGGPYVAATHANGNLIGPPVLYQGLTTPVAPGEEFVVYGNGFGNVSSPVVNGAITQSGVLSPMPVIKIGGVTAQVAFAGLNIAPGEFQFNVTVPAGIPDGDQPIVATYNGLTTQAGTLITVKH